MILFFDLTREKEEMATLVSKQRNSSACWFRASRSFLTRLNDRKFSVVKTAFPRLLVCSLQSPVSQLPLMLFLFRSSNCLHYPRFHQSSLGFQRPPSLLMENKNKTRVKHAHSVREIAGISNNFRSNRCFFGHGCKLCANLYYMCFLPA